MSVHSKWYDGIGKEISFHKDTLSAKDNKKYKLDLLLRLAKRVADFSPYCGECQMFQQDITRITEDLKNIFLMSKETKKSYFKTISDITKHLQKKHKLVSGGQNIGIWISVGTGIGVALGAALDNTGLGTAIGIAIGVAIGSYMDRKAKKEGKVI